MRRCILRISLSNAVIMKSFVSNKSDFVNYKRRHSGEKSFRCINCEKSFSNKSNLVRHMRVHSGEKLFPCTYLGKANELHHCTTTHSAEHLKIHTWAKSFQCCCCDIAFLLKINLKEHERMHSGEKPLKCSNCEKSLRNKLVRQEDTFWGKITLKLALYYCSVGPIATKQHPRLCILLKIHINSVADRRLFKE